MNSHTRPRIELTRTRGRRSRTALGREDLSLRKLRRRRSVLARACTGLYGCPSRWLVAASSGGLLGSGGSCLSRSSIDSSNGARCGSCRNKIRDLQSLDEFNSHTIRVGLLRLIIINFEIKLWLGHLLRVQGIVRARSTTYPRSHINVCLIRQVRHSPFSAGGLLLQSRLVQFVAPVLNFEGLQKRLL